jgi:Flp pilus assembly protein TadD
MRNLECQHKLEPLPPKVNAKEFCWQRSASWVSIRVVKEDFPETGSAPTALWRNRGWAFALFVIAATVLAYQPMWHAGFIWDDDVLCTANPLIKSPHGWYQFWFTNKTPDYFPVMSSVFWVEWRLWGMNAVGYHMVNVLLHAVDAILLWQLLARLKIPGARLAAAIFALHPVNVESVAWIAELKNTLSLFFFVLSLLWYLKFDDTGRRRCYWLALGAFLLALLSKIEVAPLPFVLLGVAWWRRGRVEWKDVRHSIPFFSAAFLLGLISIWFQNHVAIGHDVVRTDNFWSRLAGAGWAVWFYFGKTLLPLDLIPIYPRWQIDPKAALSYVPGLLLAAGFLVFWQWRRSWGKAPLFGLGYAVLMFLPVLGFLNIYYFRFSLVANHWQYFSIIGPVALAAAGLTMAGGFLERQNAFLKPLFCGVLLAVLGVLTWQQASIYQTAETLWRTTVAKNPECFLAHDNLGFILLQRGEVDQALDQIQMAAQLQPDDEAAQKNLGSALLQKGQVDEAMAHFQKALELRPDDSGAENNLGFALFRKGRTDEAIAHYRKALELQSDDTGARHNLGSALLRNGQVDEAIDEFQKVLAIQPDSAEAHNDLANALSENGREAEAIQHWEKSLASRPQYVPALNNLAWSLATSPDASLRNGAKAVQLARQANQLSDGKNPLILRTLAAACAENGQFAEATTTAGLALQQAAIQHNTALANSIESQSKLYEAGQPFHTTAKSNL